VSPALPALSVSLGLWQDRPSDEVLVTAIAADRLGYGELWIGEMATYDAFVLGAVIGERTERISLTLGPFAVAVRDPVMIAVGAASVAELVGRRVDVAIGSSSPVVVEQWHGRTQRRPAKALAESASALRSLLGGGRASIDGEVIHTNGFRLRTGAPNSELTIAAFGERAVRVAANHADRMVINLVTPASAGRLVSMLREATVDGPAPRVAAWVTAAVDPVPEAFEQLRPASPTSWTWQTPARTRRNYSWRCLTSWCALSGWWGASRRSPSGWARMRVPASTRWHSCRPRRTATRARCTRWRRWPQ
jgi:probable F420-dependent oxidoreductase